MKKYDKPEISVMYFQSSDIVTLSCVEEGRTKDAILSLDLGEH